jgi:hypothetical protein
MPSRKQRRRREKSFRHEWEYVEIDPESGEERPVAVAELRPEKKERPQRKPAAKGSGAKARPARAGRAPQPPSWRRVWKRTAMFAPLMAFFIYWTQSSGDGAVSAPGVILNTLILIAFFGPFSYLVDTMTYRIWTKRAAKK